jgi:hypothetical protein
VKNARDTIWRKWGSLEAAAIIKLLVEGMSVRSIERLTGAHRDTILRVLVNVGERCERLLEEKIQGVTVKDVGDAISPPIIGLLADISSLSRAVLIVPVAVALSGALWIATAVGTTD